MVQGRNSALSCDARSARCRGNSVPQRWPPLPTHTSAHAGLRGTRNGDCRQPAPAAQIIYLFIYLFLVQAPLRSGEQARTRTICGASIRFIFLPWWGQIDRKTHAGGVVVVVHMTRSYLPCALRFSGSWQGRKRHLSFHATGPEGVETFSTAATASNNNYALIRAWWGGGRAYTGTSKRSSRTKRANTQKARNLQGCNCRSCRLGWANLALLLVLISCI